MFFNYIQGEIMTRKVVAYLYVPVSLDDKIINQTKDFVYESGYFEWLHFILPWPVENIPSIGSRIQNAVSSIDYCEIKVTEVIYNLESEKEIIIEIHSDLEVDAEHFPECDIEMLLSFAEAGFLIGCTECKIPVKEFISNLGKPFRIT